MRLPMTAAVVGVQVAAFWPVWRWYAGRVDGPSEAATSLLALALAVGVPSRADDDERRRSLWPASLLTLAYAVTFPFAPSLVRALLALLAIGAAWTALHRPQASLARCGLLLLAAPLLPTLQFYLGYPLRLAVAFVSAAWLRAAGFAVSVEGTGLRWAGHAVLVDAPCSGVRMLWGALLVALATALFREWGAARTLTLCAASVGVVVLANSLRASSLFFVEAGIVPTAGFVHEATGLMAFLGASAAIAAFASRLEAETRR